MIVTIRSSSSELSSPALDGSQRRFIGGLYERSIQVPRREAFPSKGGRSPVATVIDSADPSE